MTDKIIKEFQDGSVSKPGTTSFNNKNNHTGVLIRIPQRLVDIIKSEDFSENQAVGSVFWDDQAEDGENIKMILEDNM